MYDLMNKLINNSYSNDPSKQKVDFQKTIQMYLIKEDNNMNKLEKSIRENQESVANTNLSEDLKKKITELRLEVAALKNKSKDETLTGKKLFETGTYSNMSFRDCDFNEGSIFVSCVFNDNCNFGENSIFHNCTFKGLNITYGKYCAYEICTFENSESDSYFVYLKQRSIFKFCDFGNKFSFGKMSQFDNCRFGEDCLLGCGCYLSGTMMFDNHSRTDYWEDD